MSIETGVTDVRVTVLHAAPEVGTVDVYVTTLGDDLASNAPVATLSFSEAAGPGRYRSRYSVSGADNTHGHRRRRL